MDFGSSMFWKRWRVVAAWALVVLCGLGAAAWVRERVEVSQKREGLRRSQEAAGLVREARNLEAAGSTSEARERLESAIHRLREVDGANRGNTYAAILLDLASLRLRSGTQDAPLRGEVRRLLDEAWTVPETTASLRARIARDRAALEVLDGDLRAAESWYAEALTADPEDPLSRQRLKILRETREKSQESGT